MNLDSVITGQLLQKKQAQTCRTHFSEMLWLHMCELYLTPANERLGSSLCFAWKKTIQSLSVNLRYGRSIKFGFCFARQGFFSSSVLSITSSFHISCFTVWFTSHPTLHPRTLWKSHWRTVIHGMEEVCRRFSWASGTKMAHLLSR